MSNIMFLSSCIQLHRKLCWGFIFLFVLLFSNTVFSATYTSTAAGGDWSVGSTWVGGVAPPSGANEVVIATTGTGVVTLLSNWTCKSVVVNANSRLTITGAAVILTINGAAGPGGISPSSNDGTIDGTGSITIGALSLSLDNSTTGVISLRSIISTFFAINNAGSISVTTNLDCKGFVNSQSTSVLNIGGTSTFGTSDLTATAVGNTVIYSGAAQDVFGTTYSNLTLSGSGTKSLTNATVIGGNLIISGTASFDVNGNNITANGDWLVTSTAGDPFVEGVKKVTLNGTGVQNISTVLAGGETFYDLTINSTGPILFGSATDVTVINTLVMTTGLIDINGRTFTLGASGAASTLTYTNGWFYGGTFKRFWKSGGGSAITNTNYGLFPMGTENASTYRPVKITSSGNLTADGYFTVNHVDAITITDFAAAAESIIRKSDAQFITSINGVTGGGNWTIAITMTGFNATGAVGDMRLGVSSGASIAVVGTHVNTVAPVTAPTASRNLITTLTDFNNDFRFCSTNITNTPLRKIFFSRNGGGNWNNAATWSTAACNGAAAASAPAAGDDAQICSGDVVTVNVVTTINSLSIISGGTLNGASNLTVTTDMAVSGTGVFTNTGGTWAVTRDLTITGTGSSSAGTLNITGDVNLGSGSTLTINTAASVSGNLTVSGTFALGTSGLTFGGAAKTLDGSGSITGSGTISVATAKTILSSANITIAPVFAITAGINITNNGIATLNGNLTGSAAGSTWTNAAGSTLNFGGTSILTTGTLITAAANNLVNYSGTTQTVKANTYADLTASNSGVKTLAGAVTVYETLAISGSATLASDIYQITGNLTNPMTMAAGSSLTLGNTGSATAVIFPTNYTNANITLNATSNVIYQSAGAQSISSVPTYGGLTAQTSGVKSLIGNTTVNGALAIAGTATLASDIYQITGNATYAMTMAAGTTLSLGNTGSATATAFPSNFTNANIALDVTSTVAYQSTGAQTISGVPTYGILSLLTSGTKTLDANTNINGDILIQGTTVLNMNAFNIDLKGSWNNSSSNADPFTEGTSTVTFSSTTAAQSILNTGNANGTVFYSIIVNNSFGTIPQIVLGAAVTAKNNLTMTSGIISMAGFTFVLGEAGSTSTLNRTASTTTNWFYGGTFTRQWPAVSITSTSGNYYGLFPVGESTPSTYSPLEINSTVDPTANGNFSVTYSPVPWLGFDLNPFYNDGGVDIEHILNGSFVTAVSGITGGTYSISVTMTGLDPSGSINDVRLAVYTGGTTASAVGTHVVATGTPNNPTANRSGLFIADLTTKDFRIGTTDTAATPLPVEFLSFDAKPNGTVVDVNWSTAAEFNSDYFMVQRSRNGTIFEDVVNVKAAGNSSSVKNYSAVDADPYAGLSYYRLKQVDLDGKYSFSNAVAVNFDSKNMISVFPNPASGPFNLSVSGTKGDRIALVIRDVLGREFYSEVIWLSASSEVIAIDPPGKLASGVYTVISTSDNSSCTKKFVVR